MIYCISKGNTLKTKDGFKSEGVAARAETIIEKWGLPQAEIDRLMRDGILENAEKEIIVEGQEPAPAPEVAKQEQSGSGYQVELNSKWKLDPASLADKDLDSLNLMIAERDESLEGFETEEEAIAWLSQDF